MRLSYKWQDLVGSGSFGKVFSAKVTSTNNDGSEVNGETDVALKKTRVTNHIRHPLLLHEACVLTLVRGHPNIPRVLAWGRSQYFEYIAMELLGPNIEDVVSKAGLSQRNAVAFVCQMLDAIEHIHGKGIVHGDIKPSNVCLGRGDNAGRLYLVDFGLSSRWTSDSRPSGRRGTVPYCSLRVLAGEAALPRDDLESLAYTVAHLVTGTLPWGFQSFQERLDGGPVSGKLVFRGYPDVFAEFVDFAHGLGPTDDLQYRRWRDAFRGLEPGLARVPMFDQQDSLRSGRRLWVSWAAASRGDRGFFLPDEKGEWHTSYDYKDIFGGSESQSEMGGDHGFDVLRPSEWLLLPFGIAPCCAIGDELGVVSTHLDFIDEPPLYNGGRSVDDTAPPEVMNNTQSDTRCIRL